VVGQPTLAGAQECSGGRGFGKVKASSCFAGRHPVAKDSQSWIAGQARNDNFCAQTVPAWSLTGAVDGLARETATPKGWP